MNKHYVAYWIGIFIFSLLFLISCFEKKELAELDGVDGAGHVAVAFESVIRGNQESAPFKENISVAVSIDDGEVGKFVSNSNGV